VRHPTFTEWVALTRAKRGVAPVRAVGPVAGGTAYAGAAPPWAQCQVAQAWLLALGDTGTMAWRTEAVPADLGDEDVVVPFRLAFGNGSPLPQRVGAFDLSVDGRRLVSFVAGKDGRRWESVDGLSALLFSPDLVRAAPPGHGLVLDDQLRSESWAAEGVALVRLARGLVAPGRPLELSMSAAPPTPSRTWVRVAFPEFEFEAMAIEPALDELLAPRTPARVGDRQVLFGDLHNHTGEGGPSGRVCGVGSRVEALTWARDVAGLDFCCLSEHDWQLADGEWELLQDLNDEWDAPGRFVTIHGYEWTSSSYGHRNVYFPGRGGPFVRSSIHEMVPEAGEYLVAVNERGDDDRDPPSLWDALGRWGGRAMTIPHHSSAAMFPLSLEEYFNADYDRVAEIYSCWGDSLHHDTDRNLSAQRVEELELSRFVERFPIGFIASSDSHDGHPGHAQGREHRPHLFHHHGSGQVGVHAEDFSREAIFAAVYDRRCFGLTGGRIVVDATLNGHPMGATVSAAALGQRPVLSVSVGSGVAGGSVEVFDGRRVVHTEPVRDRQAAFDWEDGAFRGEGTYYVRFTRPDGEVAWSSPIRVREDGE
jgi:hypothetical protein